MIERLRPAPTAAELDELYAAPNDADRWAEHATRVDLTVALARFRFPRRDLIIDPAAGAGRTVRELAVGRTITGDLAPGAAVDYPGTPAAVLVELAAGEPVNGRADLVILGEILEHVDDPYRLLQLAAGAGTGLILSTPLAEPAGLNHEHIWRWDRAGVTDLLDAAGWQPLDYLETELTLDHWPYPVRTQIHTATRRPT